MLTFVIYEGLLAHYSSYFRAALKKEWLGEGTRSLSLPEDNPETFNFFYHWLYTGKLYTKPAAKGEIPMEPLTICDVYIFGDMRGIPELCNSAIDLLYQRIRQLQCFPVYILKHVYGNTPDNAALRKLLVDLKVGHSPFGEKSTCDAFPPRFLHEVLQTLSRENVKLAYLSCTTAKEERAAEKTQICAKYHNHPQSDYDTNDHKFDDTTGSRARSS